MTTTMAALEDFENILKEVVNGKRLSASKMTKLTEIAMKSLVDDTKLVAILYRTHKSLPSSAKVSSLYAFDALARAARSYVTKRGIIGDIKSQTGNAATFLLKIEGVLDGLFQDMAALNNPEAKEKTKKVLDIWVKSNTFPSAVLTRLGDILSDIQKEIAVNPTSSTNPHAATQAPETVPSPPAFQVSAAAPPNAQAALLALLCQAAQTTNQGQPTMQTAPNTDPQLQQSQLALLQQLALTAKLASGSSTPTGQTTPPPSSDINPPPAAIPAPERPPPAGDPHPNTPGYARHNHPDSLRNRQEFRDERHTRGGLRGGFRGRGRWDEHHNRDRFRNRDREWETPTRQKHSRSRSPRRPEGRRNARRNSPSHHVRDPRRSPAPPADGKDEFGRDIRESSDSPSISMSVDDAQAHAPMETSVDPTAGAPPDNHIPVSEQLPLVAASTSSQSTETDTPSATAQQQPGLVQFDISTFDATVPSSWEALGNMWQATYGYTPSQEELMRFVMNETMVAAGMVNGGFNGEEGQWSKRNDPRLRGGRDRGNHVAMRGNHGPGGYQTGDESDHTEPTSYAVVLNGGDDPMDDIEGTTRSGGRMQRVEDKWVFVKDVA